MIRKFWVAAVLAIVLLNSAVVLSAAGFVNGAAWPFLAGAVLAILGILLAVYVGLELARHLRERFNSLSTRAKNLEMRERELHARSTSLLSLGKSATNRIDALEERLDQALTSVAKSSERVEASMRQELEKTSAVTTALASRLTDVEQNSQRSVRDLKVLRKRVPANYLADIESKARTNERELRATRLLAFEAAVQLGREPKSLITPDQALELFSDYLEQEKYLELRPLIENFNVLDHSSLTILRRLFQAYRRMGYWSLAATVAERLQRASGKPGDELTKRKLEREIEVFDNPLVVSPEMGGQQAYDPAGPVMFMVGKTLPATQTGYTLRTHYTATALVEKGVRTIVVGQAGLDGCGDSDVVGYVFDGIEHFLLPGKPRNHCMLDEWLALNMRELAALVQRVRPSILHAQSDFFNEIIVNRVGQYFGIPTVYESRGFWEESWLSRTVNANGWARDQSRIFSTYGVPEAYTLRKGAEETARLQPDHVFTLAEVMKDHIIESGEGELHDETVTIVPNAVDASKFPVQQRDPELGRELGIPDDAITIGYISSIVEYEGIDTLIRAFRRVQNLYKGEQPLWLLLVGDGDDAPRLRKFVEEKNIANVVFTGRVPHEDILRYYGLIDVFVVPRKPTEVAHLVTPLKPFEAFATGRCLVLSDVRALQEIASQSNSTETFRAGDDADLSRVLLRLINDPERRRELAESGARWVRNHRSWRRNVNEYYRVYRKLGYMGERNLAVEAGIELEHRGANAGEIVELLAASEMPPVKGWFSIQESRQTASQILAEGWRFASFEPVRVQDIEDWSWYGNQHRSWGFHLQAWEFMDPLIAAYDETKDVAWLREAVSLAEFWIRNHVDRKGDENDDGGMAWYDMSQSLRAPRLLALALRSARVPEFAERTQTLAAALIWHMEELHKDRAFNPNNNHGFYTAVSQVHLAKYIPEFPDAATTGAEGAARLEIMAKAQFAVDGTHLEHSPDYHRMLLNSFESAVRDGLIEDEDVRARVERAAHVFGWMIQPDGTLVQFGDSPETRVVKSGLTSIDPETQFLLTDGDHGTAPNSSMKVLHDGGYAFVRSPQPLGAGELQKSGYLAFSAAFHSRAHKHADDLNVVWYDRGVQILTDAGRFGYGNLLPTDSPLRKEGFYYADPQRQFVEGTLAHNTLMMDGKNQNRRDRPPYGSGIGDCTEKEGVFDLSGRVHHADYIHRRRVVYRPGDQLLIKDSVFSQAPEAREGVLWFNLNGDFELESTEEDVVFVLPNGETKLRVRNDGRLIEPVRGQAEPLRGWRSRKDRTMVPTWSLGFVLPIEVRAAVDTSFSFE
jgi:glycosyltransferase involved in cell wall biosynthesis